MERRQKCVEQKSESSGNGDQPDGVQLFTPAADKKDEQHNQHGAPTDGRHTAEIEQRMRTDTPQGDRGKDRERRERDRRDRLKQGRNIYN